jgi:hypothetical protein
MRHNIIERQRYWEIYFLVYFHFMENMRFETKDIKIEKIVHAWFKTGNLDLAGASPLEVLWSGDVGYQRVLESVKSKIKLMICLKAFKEENPEGIDWRMSIGEIVAKVNKYSPRSMFNE